MGTSLVLCDTSRLTKNLTVSSHQPNPTHPSSAHLVSLSYPLSPSRKTFHSIRKPSSNQKSPHLRSARNLRLVGHNDASIIAKSFQKGNSFPTLQKDVSPTSSSSPTPYPRSSHSSAPPVCPAEAAIVVSSIPDVRKLNPITSPNSSAIVTTKIALRFSCCAILLQLNLNASENSKLILTLP